MIADAPAPETDGAPVGPSADEESSFLAEQKASDPVSTPPRAAANGNSEPEPTGSLPPLDDLVNRIPAPARELLDELFRAKFVTVKRVPKSALKS